MTRKSLYMFLGILLWGLAGPAKAETGILELLPAGLDFTKKNSELPISLTNSGDAPLIWRVTKGPKEFQFQPSVGKIDPGKEETLIVKWVSCLNTNQGGVPSCVEFLQRNLVVGS